VFKSFTPQIPPNLQKLWGERKNKGGEHQIIQDLDPMCCPQNKKGLVDGDVDIDLLSLFPRKHAKNMGRIGRRKTQEGL
jgi:hypothetical protein